MTGLFSQYGCSNGNGNILTDLELSRDTVYFDTVFSQLGSSTKVLKVINRGSDLMKINRISLGSGGSSTYRFNADGYPSSPAGVVNDPIEIEPGDSIFVFIEITIDPNGGNHPLIVLDSLIFETDFGSRQAILAAWGQDGEYYFPTDTNSQGLPYSIIGCNTVWKPGKPYVIIGYAFVQPGCTLTILPGTKVHFFNNGGLAVLEGGVLQVLGEVHDPVVFEGTRLEFAYRENPGQWNGILLYDGSTSHVIKNAVIKNARASLQLVNISAINGNTPGPAKVTLENVKILNSSAIGIYSILYDITGYNVLSANSGQYCGAFTFGGTIEFNHSTFANYWSGSNRQTPAIFLNNFFIDDQNAFASDMNIRFNNCIVYGALQNEFDYDTVTAANMNFRFDHSLIKIDPQASTSNPSRFVSIVKNQDPYFRSVVSNDYRIADTSAAVNIGDISFVQQAYYKLLFDLAGSNRTYSGAPDAGAFEAP